MCQSHQQLKRLRDLDDAGPAAGHAVLAGETALYAERAEVVHGGIEREPRGDVSRPPDEVRGGRVRRGGDAGAVCFAPEGCRSYCVRSELATLSRKAKMRT